LLAIVVPSCLRPASAARLPGIRAAAAVGGALSCRPAQAREGIAAGTSQPGQGSPRPQATRPPGSQVRASQFLPARTAAGQDGDLTRNPMIPPRLRSRRMAAQLNVTARLPAGPATIRRLTHRATAQIKGEHANPPFGAAAWLLALVSRGAQIWVFGAVGR
jgi:hypothetical protein